MQDPVSVMDVQNWQGGLPCSIGSFPRPRKEFCHSFKFSEVLRTFSGLKLRSKPSKTQRLLVQYDQTVPSRANITTSAICVCIKFSSEW
jgi:hypothetical protein